MSVRPTVEEQRALQEQRPNFRERGKLYLVRCFICGVTSRGRENWAPMVAASQCAWCGWREVSS